MSIPCEIKLKLRRRLILSSLIYFIMQLMIFVSPLIMGFIIDDYIPNKNVSAIIIGIILFVAIPLATILFQMIYNYFSITFARNIGNELSLTIMKNLIYKENQFFDQGNSLELLSYSSKEAVNYVSFYISDLAKYYTTIILSIILFLIITAFFNPILGIIQLLYIPLAYFPVKKMMKTVEKNILMIIENNAKMNQIKGDTFKAIEFIKIMRIEESKINEVEMRNKEIVKVWGKIAVFDMLCGSWGSGFVTALFTGLTFGLGALFCILQTPYLSLKVGKVVTIMSYCGLFYSYILQILNTKANKRKHQAEYEKLFSYLSLYGEREENTNKIDFDFKQTISFNNASFSYLRNNDLALNKINMAFKINDWTGIIGKSGSGKSTILDIILKLYKIDNNMVMIDGNDINNFNSFSIRSNITKISQNVHLFPGTIKDNLLLVNKNASDKDIINALDFACLNEYITSLPMGINTDVGEAGKLMSGGERQRLSIAMGILRNTKILLLDEVTSHLDEDIERQLAENFYNLLKEGYTIISISH